MWRHLWKTCFVNFPGVRSLQWMSTTSQMNCAHLLCMGIPMFQSRRTLMSVHLTLEIHFASMRCDAGGCQFCIPLGWIVYQICCCHCHCIILWLFFASINSWFCDSLKLPKSSWREREREISCCCALHRYNEDALPPWTAISTAVGIFVIGFLVGHMLHASRNRIDKVEENCRMFEKLKDLADEASVAKSQVNLNTLPTIVGRRFCVLV